LVRSRQLPRPLTPSCKQIAPLIQATEVPEWRRHRQQRRAQGLRVSHSMVQGSERRLECTTWRLPTDGRTGPALGRPRMMQVCLSVPVILCFLPTLLPILRVLAGHTPAHPLAPLSYLVMAQGPGRRFVLRSSGTDQEMLTPCLEMGAAKQVSAHSMRLVTFLLFS